MKSALKFLPWSLFCLSSALVQGAATLQPREETIFLFENRKVTIAVPTGFGYAANKDELRAYQVKLGDAKNRVSLDIVFLPDAEEQFNQPRARREMLAEHFSAYVDSSSEKGMQFEELTPRAGAGTYCVFTDAKLIGK